MADPPSLARDAQRHDFVAGDAQPGNPFSVYGSQAADVMATTGTVLTSQRVDGDDAVPVVRVPEAQHALVDQPAVRHRHRHGAAVKVAAVAPHRRVQQPAQLGGGRAAPGLLLGTRAGSAYGKRCLQAHKIVCGA